MRAHEEESRSIDFPNPGRGEFDGVTIGVSEIETHAAAVPSHFAFDLDSVLGKMASPPIKVLSAHGEREVCWALSVVRWNPTSGK